MGLIWPNLRSKLVYFYPKMASKSIKSGGEKLTTFGSKSDGITQVMKSGVNFFREKGPKVYILMTLFAKKFHGITQFTKSEVKFCFKKMQKSTLFTNFLRNVHNL